MTDMTRRKSGGMWGEVRHATVCAQCGYGFARGDSILRINLTQDCIHRDCFPDYFDENMEEFCDELEI